MFGPAYRSARLIPTLLFALSALAACDPASQACTEIGCESQGVVTFDRPLNEVYTLVIEFGSQSAEARCNDEGSLASSENPEWISCNTSGFEITGEAANGGELEVSITLADAEETPVLSRELVSMGVTEDGLIEPNGPGCEPVCFERRGSIILPDAV